MKTITFSVHIEFEEPIDGTDSQIKDMAENILAGMICCPDEAYLAPYGSDAFVTLVSVSHSGIELCRKDSDEQPLIK